MPTVNIPIKRAWRHRNEETRIHYAVERQDGSIRHLYADEGSPLYDVLNEHLKAMGYTAPASSLVDL